MKVIAGGQTIELGVTEAQPTIGIIDYSRRETDDFGVTKVVARGFARRMSVRILVATDEVDALQRRLASLRATPAQWVADEQFASLSFEGFYKEFSIDLSVPPVSFCTLTIEGLAETEPASDTGGDPAVDGERSTLRLIQPAAITDAMLTSSNVPENDYPAWASGTTYALGARVIAAHRIFESAAAGNVGNNPASGSSAWLDLGPTNRWAMFDEALGTATERANSVAVVIDPVDPVTAVALLDVSGSTVRVQASGYDRTIALAADPGMAQFLDLPSVSGPITMTISGSGTVSVGTLLIGRLVDLGVTEASPTAAITDYSRKETDDFGDVTVVERAWAKRMTVRALLRSDAVDLVANRIAAVRARPCLWIAEESLQALSIYGFFKDFSIEVGENVSTLSLSVEGLSTAGKVAPLVGDVSWSDVKDDDPAHPKPQDGADVTGDNIAKDTMAVGLKPSTVVLQELGLAGNLGFSNESWIKKQEGFDPNTGYLRSNLMVNYLGIHVAAQTIGAGPGGSFIAFRASNFYFYDDDDGNGTPLLSWEASRMTWRMPAIEVDTITAGSVITTSIASAAVSQGTQAQQASNFNLSSSWQTAVSYNVTIPAGEQWRVTCLTSGILGFPSGDKLWEIQLLMDGVPVQSGGGLKTADFMTLSGQRTYPAGTYTIAIQVRGDTSVVCSQMTINVQWMKR